MRLWTSFNFSLTPCNILIDLFFMILGYVLVDPWCMLRLTFCPTSTDARSCRLRYGFWLAPHRGYRILPMFWGLGEVVDC
jgi:hypothetical protein